MCHLCKLETQEGYVYLFNPPHKGRVNSCRERLGMILMVTIHVMNEVSENPWLSYYKTDQHRAFSDWVMLKKMLKLCLVCDRQPLLYLAENRTMGVPALWLQRRKEETEAESNSVELSQGALSEQAGHHTQHPHTHTCLIIFSSSIGTRHKDSECRDGKCHFLIIQCCHF